MFSGIELGHEARERHNDLLRQAAAHRLAQTTKQAKTYHYERTRWSSAALIWLGQHLIGWGQQLQRAA